MKKHYTVNIVQLKMVHEKRALYDTTVGNAQGVVNMVASLFKNSYREIVVVVGLNTRHLPTMIHVVSYGSCESSMVYVASIFKALLVSNSTGFILLHNHPGNSLKPSSADEEVTRKVQKMGKDLEITCIDHIIVNADCSDFYSFAQERVL